MKRWLTITVALFATVYIVTESASGGKRGTAPETSDQPPVKIQEQDSGDNQDITATLSGNLVPALSGITARSPNFNVDWYSINSGGDTRAHSASFASGVSVAQTATGEASSASFVMNLGFWQPSGCCVGSTGNIDNDPADITDIADLTFLIDNLFINFTIIPCPEEGNIDGDPAGIVDIADLTFLIDNLFINFTPTSRCR